MQHFKLIYESVIKSGIQKKQNQIVFECFICFNQFDSQEHLPLTICSNQHNLCKICVQANLFKKKSSIIQQTGIQVIQYQCPLCQQMLNNEKFKKNNLLIEIVQWIEENFKKQRKQIQQFKSYINEIQTDLQKRQKKYNDTMKQNYYLKGLVDALQKQNSLLKKQLQIKQQSIYENKGLLIQNIDLLIEKYEQIVLDLKKRKKQQNMTQNFPFSFDLNHPHLKKFILNLKTMQIEMQKLLIRSFFQNVNFYYNVKSAQPISLKLLSQKYLYFQVKIIESKDGKINIGLCGKDTIYRKNVYMFRDFIGIFIKNGKITYKNKSYSTKVQNIGKNDKVSICINKQLVVWKVNGENVYEIETSNIFPDQKYQLYPVISMQMIGDKVRIIKEKTY